MPRVAAVLALAGVLGLLAAPAVAGTSIDHTGQAWQIDPVYVDPAAEQAIPAADADRIRRAIVDRRAGPMYVAILPAAAAHEAGGSPDGVVSALQEMLRRDGTYAVVVGRAFRASSTNLGGVAAAADDANAAHGKQGVTATLVDFAGRVGALRAGDESGSGDGGNGPGGTGALVLLGLAAVGGGALLVSRRRRREREGTEFAEVRANAREDVVALGADVRALDGRRADGEDHARAVDAYHRANTGWEQSRHPEDLEPVAAALEEGRWALACAQARSAGRPAPEHTPPCFFDPRHGPSVRDVGWAPDGGEPRPVPACAADAQRVERGEDPDVREVVAGGRRMPYWDAGPLYAPFAAGFFGGLGVGRFAGLIAGTPLGDALWPGMAWGDDGADEFRDATRS